MSNGTPTPQPPVQGIYMTAAFDHRMIVRERKNDDGSYSKTHYLGLIARTDTATNLYQVRTKQPEKYANIKQNQLVTVRVFPRAFKDNVYYSDES
ncbi:MULTISPECIES: hypothetical protein [unclassified Neisseria]|uniref:hypothetical protein n=1 Tax=unclassified Neisseria TaxID=2623750 RepID=UPI0010719E81|nr:MULTISPECIES: hypothetical protein [unclassified Neisseria]MBF0803900.1 hypothetical protein [Neisseria sp. 19428wB4_WF04]TFU43327.1 hypothetical protein E4T99_05950 [Neisseria sp. WF04]